MYNLQYPIGPYQRQMQLTAKEFEENLKVLEAFPKLLDIIIQNKDEPDFLKTYRPNGWTAAQVIHHCADSHMNCLFRLKLALTEVEPTIRPYEEDRWALCKDYDLPVNNSITLLHTVHHKLVAIFSQLSEAERARPYYHPANEQWYSIDALLSLYAWHCKHHFEHLRIAFGLVD